MVNIGLLGLGTVGTGVVEIIEKRKSELKDLTEKDINIKKVLVKNIDKERNIKLEPDVLTSCFEEILKDKEIDIIIEVTGDVELSYKYITESLNSGKHVVTANKAVVSKYFEELSALAEEKNLAFLYEASVGGGIPVLKSLKEALALNKISQVLGILNGTCNYILTRMVDEGKNYDEVLKIAQKLGYAEADPTADVEGHDTLRKLRILGTLVLQGEIKEEDILLGGISAINSNDINLFKMMNSTIKLVAEAKIYEEGYTAVVLPTIVKNSNYFANVNMAFNSVAFEGNNVGQLKFYGSGAGKLPTANAVLSDVLDIVMDTYRKGNPLGNRELVNMNSKIKEEFYLRVSGTNDEIIKALRKISKKVLTIGATTAIITEEIELSKLEDIMSSFKVDKKRYFLARILD
ncbi:homoserine dehydrogenase [Tissierella sp. Yu-01]|uniref:homoserine dehydrogenase n=1 Tax=Tissierella sp. Yu-01 TaxID=3035694 RepID=UPI00240E1F61|nr:homoserine dehydrogenase [Tissierella sp. Yu-01]WFA08420.1 homoserine dehydrogenase [Tissierella sp. Yu-01]